MNTLDASVYSLQEAADRLGWSYQKAVREKNASRLSAVRVGREYRVSQQEVERLLTKAENKDMANASELARSLLITQSRIRMEEKWTELRDTARDYTHVHDTFYEGLTQGAEPERLAELKLMFSSYANRMHNIITELYALQKCEQVAASLIEEPVRE